MFRASGTLSQRLSRAFAVVAALTMVLSTLILSSVWAGQFDAYVREGLQETADGAAQLLAGLYLRDGAFTVDAFSQMPRFGTMSGLALQVLEPSGAVIYDDMAMGVKVEELMGSSPPEYPEPSGSPVISPVIVDGEIVGVVRVWALSPEGLLTDNDLRFRRSSFLGLAAAAIVSVLLASIAGVWFAVTLVRPIDRITETAKAVRGGDRDARTDLDGDDAISVLGKTFDEMADSIEADRAMERQLTADVAHELRTPLQAIRATVEAMQDGVLPADGEHLAVVRDETVRLARLTSGILELVRLESGSVPMNHVPLDIASPARAAIEANRALIEMMGLTLHADIADGIVISGDADFLTQAVGNLLSNAARYTSDGGSVMVAVRVDGDRALIEVADTGVGIDSEDAEKVFVRFWRADEARESTSGGLGIGLAVVKEIVERHGGTVGVSPRQGGGSVFALRIPLGAG